MNDYVNVIENYPPPMEPPDWHTYVEWVEWNDDGGYDD
jgi:hypothetical protein